MNLLSLEKVSVSYGDVAVIREVSLSVEEGAITCLVGSNGAGKSSLLQALSGIIACKKGTIVFDGKDITAWPSHQRVGMGLVQVPEGRHVFPYMNVLENLELGLSCPGCGRNEKKIWPRSLTSFPGFWKDPDRWPGP